MNHDDVPHAPVALDTEYSRRIRCVRMRAKFPSTLADIDPVGGVYQKDDTPKDWIRRGGSNQRVLDDRDNASY